MLGRIWLIGGTQESAELALEIAQLNLPYIVTVTTEAARSLYPTAANLQIWVGRLNSESLLSFLQHWQIKAILDASHPFAVEISQLAIESATQHQIPYLRYERPSLEQAEIAPDILYLDSFETLVQGNWLRGERVLLTVGYRSLQLFQPWQTQATLFARILPSVTALEAALEAGFTPDRLIAIRPPISIELERALWQQWQISLVVTKASGTAGGEDVKRQIAADLGVKLILVDRPSVIYPQQTSDTKEALEFCYSSLNLRNS